MLAFAADGPRAVFPETAYQFGKVLHGSVVQHAFTIRNTGDQVLAVKNVTMSVPLKLLHMPSTVPPGTEEKLTIALDTREAGSFYEGIIVVTTDDPAQPESQLTFDGNIVSTIEVSPIPAFYVSVAKGQPKEESLDIINHEAEPLRIERIDTSSDRFTTRLVTVEDGQRYKLFLKMSPTAALGKKDEVIRIHTSSAEHPVVNVGAHTYVREKVYTFPPSVEFGQLRMSTIGDAKLADLFTQRLVVYDKGNPDFKVQVSSDLPFLTTVSRPSPAGDRFEVFVTVDPAKATPGSYAGTLQIVTNDSSVPKLTVPVSIAVVQ